MVVSQHELHIVSDSGRWGEQILFLLSILTAAFMADFMGNRA